MSMYIEPGETTVEVDGETIAVRVMTARERVRLLSLGSEIAELVGGEEEVTPTIAAQVQGLHLDILAMALVDGEAAADRLPTGVWPALVGQIFKVNKLSGDDEKN